MNIQIENFNTHYQIEGTGSNGILFVHGLGGDHKIWRKNITPFLKDHCVISVDLFGHGLSEKKVPPKKAWDLTPDLLHAIIKREQLKQVAIVGHSIAGLILQEYANRFHADRLVLVDCAFNDDVLIERRTAIGCKVFRLGIYQSKRRNGSKPSRNLETQRMTRLSFPRSAPWRETGFMSSSGLPTIFSPFQKKVNAV